MDLHQVLHIAIAAYLAFGWAFFPVIHAPCCVGVIVHWLLNKNRCILSGDYDDENGFVTELLGRIGINIQGNETLKSLVPYLLVLGPLAVSVVLAIKGYSFGPDIFKKKLAYTGALFPILFTLKKVYDMFFGRVEDAAFRGGGVPAAEPASAPVEHVEVAADAPIDSHVEVDVEPPTAAPAVTA